MANVKYYINGKESNSITLNDADSTNSIDVQVLDASAPAPTDFIFKQFVKVTEESKWTEDVKNAVDEKGAIAFLPFKDTGTGKNQIYAQGSYFGGGLDSSDVDASAASFQDNSGKTMILTVGSDGKLRFVSYKAIARTAQSGGATFEFDSKKTGGTVSLSATFDKEFTSSGWGDGATNNQKSGLVQTATGTYVSNTNKTWNLTVTETVGDASNGNRKATANASQSVTFGAVSKFVFMASTPNITPTDINIPETGRNLTLNKTGIEKTDITCIDTSLGTSTLSLSGNYGKINISAENTNMYIYFIVRGNLTNSTYKYKLNGAFKETTIYKIGNINIYGKNVQYTICCAKDNPQTSLNNGTTISLS